MTRDAGEQQYNAVQNQCFPESWSSDLLCFQHFDAKASIRSSVRPTIINYSLANPCKTDLSAYNPEFVTCFQISFSWFVSESFFISPKCAKLTKALVFSPSGLLKVTALSKRLLLPERQVDRILAFIFRLMNLDLRSWAVADMWCRWFWWTAQIIIITLWLIWVEVMCISAVNYIHLNCFYSMNGLGYIAILGWNNKQLPNSSCFWGQGDGRILKVRNQSELDLLNQEHQMQKNIGTELKDDQYQNCTCAVWLWLQTQIRNYLLHSFSISSLKHITDACCLVATSSPISPWHITRWYWNKKMGMMCMLVKTKLILILNIVLVPRKSLTNQVTCLRRAMQYSAY